MLRAIGVHVSVFDCMALLIVMFTVGQLPIGPSTGPAAAVLILGAHGVAATAAAGVLLTVTGILGSLCFAGWAITDRIVGGRLNASPGRWRATSGRGTMSRAVSRGERPGRAVSPLGVREPSAPCSRGC